MNRGLYMSFSEMMKRYGEEYATNVFYSNELLDQQAADTYNAQMQEMQTAMQQMFGPEPTSVNVPTVNTAEPIGNKPDLGDGDDEKDPEPRRTRAASEQSVDSIDSTILAEYFRQAQGLPERPKGPEPTLVDMSPAYEPPVAPPPPPAPPAPPAPPPPPNKPVTERIATADINSFDPNELADIRDLLVLYTRYKPLQTFGENELITLDAFLETGVNDYTRESYIGTLERWARKGFVDKITLRDGTKQYYRKLEMSNMLGTSTNEIKLLNHFFGRKVRPTMDFDLKKKRPNRKRAAQARRQRFTSVDSDVTQVVQPPPPAPPLATPTTVPKKKPKPKLTEEQFLNLADKYSKELPRLPNTRESRARIDEMLSDLERFRHLLPDEFDEQIAEFYEKLEALPVVKKEDEDDLMSMTSGLARHLGRNQPALPLKEDSPNVTIKQEPGVQIKQEPDVQVVAEIKPEPELTPDPGPQDISDTVPVVPPQVVPDEEPPPLELVALGNKSGATSATSEKFSNVGKVPRAVVRDLQAGAKKYGDGTSLPSLQPKPKPKKKPAPPPPPPPPPPPQPPQPPKPKPKPKKKVQPPPDDSKYDDAEFIVDDEGLDVESSDDDAYRPDAAERAQIRMRNQRLGVDPGNPRNRMTLPTRYTSNSGVKRARGQELVYNRVGGFQGIRNVRALPSRKNMVRESVPGGYVNPNAQSWYASNSFEMKVRPSWESYNYPWLFGPDGVYPLIIDCPEECVLDPECDCP